MPELPEVETIRRQLCQAGVEGTQIDTVWIGWTGMVAPRCPEEISSRLAGRKIVSIDRAGKWLIFRLDGTEHLLIHLRMTGGFYLTSGRIEKGVYDRGILRLKNGTNLHFRDPRKFGRWRLGETPAGLGPDALEVSKKEWVRRLSGRRGTLKAALLDQAFIAGIGNIYADESLFEARLAPGRITGTLSDAEYRALYRAVRNVLLAGIRNGGTSLGGGRSNYRDLNGQSGGHREKVKVYGRAGQPCVVCRKTLCKTRIAQRTTVFCAHCQK